MANALSNLLPFTIIYDFHFIARLWESNHISVVVAVMNERCPFPFPSAFLWLVNAREGKGQFIKIYFKHVSLAFCYS